MRITIWGARGSIPSPIKSEKIEEKIVEAILNLPAHVDTKNAKAVQAYVKGLPYLRRGTAGGNTACVQIETENELIIIDAGSGIRELGDKLMEGPCGQGKGVIHMLFTHVHWDHLQGFPFFKPAFVPGNKLIIYSVRPQKRKEEGKIINQYDVETALRRQQNAPDFFPINLDYMQATREFIQLEPREPFFIGDLFISTIENIHPGIAYSYRIENEHNIFVFASDAAYTSLRPNEVEPVLKFFHNADALIFDAQLGFKETQTNKSDWGHSSAMIGVDFARAAGVKKLILFHHDPSYSDKKIEKILATAQAYQEANTTLPTCEILAAYEGWTLELTPEEDAPELQIEAAEIGTGVTLPSHQPHLEKLAEQLENLNLEYIDLSNVDTLNTSLLQRLVKISEGRSSPIILVAPSRATLKVIELGDFEDHFPIYASVDEANEAVQARAALKLPGHVIKERYKILQIVGDGRLGTVLKAKEIESDRYVSLKILNSAFRGETIKRFQSHAEHLKSLRHSNIVKVYDIDFEGRIAFIVEEFVSAFTLRQKLDAALQDVSDFQQTINIILNIVHALEHAHTNNVIHTDLKPQNIFITENRLKVSGFGQGRLVEGRHLLNSPFLFMSAPYLAPEQILGQSLDIHTDLYALGAIIYELFTGTPPFVGVDQAVKRAHLNQPPRPPRELNPHIPLPLEELTLKLLAKNPNNRYANIQQVKNIISSLITHTNNSK